MIYSKLKKKQCTQFSDYFISDRCHIASFGLHIHRYSFIHSRIDQSSNQEEEEDEMNMTMTILLQKSIDMKSKKSSISSNFLFCSI